MFALFVMLLASITACSPQAPLSPTEVLVKRGRQVYQTNCAACHNADPKLKGSLGPDVWGSSKELLTARIVHGNYPAGYTPKKAGGGMPALPHLKNEIDALYEYLNAQP